MVNDAIPIHPLRRWRVTTPWINPDNHTQGVMPIRVAAAQVGVGVSTWHSWEKWHTMGGIIPPVDAMAKICRLTGLKPGDFYLMEDAA